MSRALYTGYHPPAALDSVHFFGAAEYFYAIILRIVYFSFSRHNAASTVLFLRLVRHAENGCSYFERFPQKRSLRPACAITIKVQCRGAPGLCNHQSTEIDFPLKASPGRGKLSPKVTDEGAKRQQFTSLNTPHPSAHFVRSHLPPKG